MKILQINKYHTRNGGSDTVYFNTSKLLEQNGHEVVSFAMQVDTNLPAEKNQYFIARTNFRSPGLLNKLKNVSKFFYSLDAKTKLETLIIGEKPDLAHLHTFYGSLTSSILPVLKKHKIPTVVTVHDYKFVCPGYLFLDGNNKVCEKCRGKNFYQCTLNKCAQNNRLQSLIFTLEAYFRDALYPIEKFIDQFIFVSEFSKNIHLKFKPELGNKSTRLFNFDPNIENKKPTSVKGDYFLYAGRLAREKGIATLLQAFVELPGYKLKIAGRGPLKEDVLNFKSENIEYCGFKSGEELDNLVQNASFIITPSECYENNPMAVIEAMTLGKPVIGSRIGGIPELVIENKTGFLFSYGSVSELKDRIKKAAQTNDQEYRKLSENCVQFAGKNFNPETHYNKLIAVYKKVIREKSAFMKAGNTSSAKKI
jgi:glycosyltransferase involved in cell wall biosynthesis